MSLREFRLMKPTAVLINTSRGGVVNQADLVKALNKNIIAGAALDVLEKEPPSMHDPLLSLSNVILSPHCASHSQESLTEVRRRAVEEVLRALEGRPLLNVVNREALAARPGGLVEHGFDGLVRAMEVLLNEAMMIERAAALAAAPYERSPLRRVTPTASSPSG